MPPLPYPWTSGRQPRPSLRGNPSGPRPLHDRQFQPDYGNGVRYNNRTDSPWIRIGPLTRGLRKRADPRQDAWPPDTGPDGPAASREPGRVPAAHDRLLRLFRSRPGRAWRGLHPPRQAELFRSMPPETPSCGIGSQLESGCRLPAEFSGDDVEGEREAGVYLPEPASQTVYDVHGISSSLRPTDRLSMEPAHVSPTNKDPGCGAPISAGLPSLPSSPFSELAAKFHLWL